MYGTLLYHKSKKEGSFLGINPSGIICWCRPIIRSVMMIAFLIYFIVTVVTSPVGTSHLSHVGGFLSGLFPALLFLPHLKSERCDHLSYK